MPLFLCSLPLPFPFLTQSVALSDHGRQSEYAKPSFFGKLREQPLPIGPDVGSIVNGSLQLTSPSFLVLAKSQFFLFSYSEKGTEAAGILMMFIRTARLNQVDSEKHIAYVLTQLGKTSQEDIGRLLP